MKELEIPLGRSMALLAKAYYAALAKKLGHLELDRHYTVLLVAESTEEGQCTQQFLCEQLKIDKVSMVRIVQYLIDKGFVSKQVNPENKREKPIVLTPKAKRILPELHQAIRAVNRSAMQGMNAEQRRQLEHALNQMQHNLEQLPAERIFIQYKKNKPKA